MTEHWMSRELDKKIAAEFLAFKKDWLSNQELSGLSDIDLMFLYRKIMLAEERIAKLEDRCEKCSVG